MSETNGAEGITAHLAQFISTARWADIPPPVRHEARRSLVNFFACALGGCHDAAIESAAAAMRPYAGRPAATLIGRGEKSDALTAAFLNAGSANVFDFDDTHARTIIHPTAPVAPALFALAETSTLAGRDLLLAFVLGVEIECRVGNAISPGHYRRGWHITSTCGVFGSAAAIAKAHDLPTERIKWALGNASAQAGGLLETLGTMGKSVSVGNAARNGYLAAQFAREGLSGPEHPLEGTYGFLRVTGEDPDFACLTEGLGEHWELASNTYKPYPCGIVLSPVLEACLALAGDPRLRIGEVERIEITGHPLLRERTDRLHPSSGREAQVSAQHGAAVALARRKAGLAEFSDGCAQEPGLRPLREKVSFIDDSSYAVERATVTVHLRSGTPLVHTVDQAYGSTGRPLTDADLERKLVDLIGFGGSKCDAAALAEAIWLLDSAADAGAVMALAAGGNRG